MPEEMHEVVLREWGLHIRTRIEAVSCGEEMAVFHVALAWPAV
jgi:hypothetical protein